VSLNTVTTVVAWAMLAPGSQLCWKKTHCIIDNMIQNWATAHVKWHYPKLLTTAKLEIIKKGSQQCEYKTVMKLAVADVTHAVC
jgi:hypothetical protein